MEELKLLVQMVANLPMLAVWVIVAFYVYKVFIIGSVYGVIRYVTGRIYDWAVTKKTTPDTIQNIRLYDNIYNLTINNETVRSELMFQIKRIAGQGNKNDENPNFINGTNVLWLIDAINMKINDDIEKAKQTVKESE